MWTKRFSVYPLGALYYIPNANQRPRIGSWPEEKRFSSIIIKRAWLVSFWYKKCEYVLFNVNCQTCGVQVCHAMECGTWSAAIRVYHQSQHCEDSSNETTVQIWISVIRKVQFPNFSAKNHTLNAKIHVSAEPLWRVAILSENKYPINQPTNELAQQQQPETATTTSRAAKKWNVQHSFVVYVNREVGFPPTTATPLIPSLCHGLSRSPCSLEHRQRCQICGKKSFYGFTVFVDTIYHQCFFASRINGFIILWKFIDVFEIVKKSEIQIDSWFLASAILFDSF